MRLLWFYAHADYNTASITPSGNMHGMPVAVLTGTGPQALVEMSAAVPAIDSALCATSACGTWTWARNSAPKRSTKGPALSAVDARTPET